MGPNYRVNPNIRPEDVLGRHKLAIGCGAEACLDHVEVADRIVELESRLAQAVREKDAVHKAIAKVGVVHPHGDVHAIEFIGKALGGAVGRAFAAEDKRDEALARLACVEKERDRLREALWGFDYNPDGKPGSRGYFCAGCDLIDAHRADSAFHDDECAAARAALTPTQAP